MGFYGTFENGMNTVKALHRESVWSRPPNYHIEPCLDCGTKQALKGSSTVEPGVGVRYIGAVTGDTGWIVICPNCMRMTKNRYETREEAIQEWNGDDIFGDLSC